MNLIKIELLVPSDKLKHLPKLYRYLKNKLSCEYRIQHMKADTITKIIESKGFNQ